MSKNFTKIKADDFNYSAFKLIGKVDGSKYVVESLKYNYKVTDSNGKSRRIYNTVNR